MLPIQFKATYTITPYTTHKHCKLRYTFPDSNNYSVHAEVDGNFQGNWYFTDMSTNSVTINFDNYLTTSQNLILFFIYDTTNF